LPVEANIRADPQRGALERRIGAAGNNILCAKRKIVLRKCIVEREFVD
jgi:hypothetical protein